MLIFVYLSPSVWCVRVYELTLPMEQLLPRNQIESPKISNSQFHLPVKWYALGMEFSHLQISREFSTPHPRSHYSVLCHRNMIILCLPFVHMQIFPNEKLLSIFRHFIIPTLVSWTETAFCRCWKVQRNRKQDENSHKKNSHSHSHWHSHNHNRANSKTNIRIFIHFSYPCSCTFTLTPSCSLTLSLLLLFLFHFCVYMHCTKMWYIAKLAANRVGNLVRELIISWKMLHLYHKI